MLTIETLVRVLVFLPLLFITYQVIRLANLLRSRAWTLLVIGFILFTLIQAIQFVYLPPLKVRLGIAFLGYGFIAFGFHTLRNDLLKVIHSSTLDQETE